MPRDQSPGLSTMCGRSRTVENTPEPGLLAGAIASPAVDQWASSKYHPNHTERFLDHLAALGGGFYGPACPAVPPRAIWPASLPPPAQ
jgi:hypothetical protein